MHFYDHEGEACNYCEHVSSQVSRLAYFLKLFLAGCPFPLISSLKPSFSSYFYIFSASPLPTFKILFYLFPIEFVLS